MEGKLFHILSALSRRIVGKSVTHYEYCTPKVSNVIMVLGGHKAWSLDGCTYSQIVASLGLSFTEIPDIAEQVNISLEILIGI